MQSLNFKKLQTLLFVTPPIYPIDHYEKLNPETLYDPKISLDWWCQEVLELYDQNYRITLLETLQFKGNIYFEIDPTNHQKKLDSIFIRKRG